MIETMEDIGGQVLPKEKTFCFECRPDLACFGSCCRDKRLPLMPYDAIRLRRALGLASDDLLAHHIELETDPRSGWPALRIRLTDSGRCPFLGDAGCTVYPDRPTCCRIYPVVRAVKARGRRAAPQEIFMRQETTTCLGWDQDQALTPAQWIEDQDLTEYFRYNDALIGLVMHPKRRGKLDLAPRQVHAFIAALYNQDIFKRLVREPGFAERFGFSAKQMNRALSSDEDLMLLGRDWLIVQLFGK